MEAYYLFNGIILVSAVAIVPVTPQCSESHRIACSLPLLKLGETADLIQVADGNMPILNKSMLRRVCSYQSQMSVTDRRGRVFLTDRVSLLRTLMVVNKQDIKHQSIHPLFGQAERDDGQYHIEFHKRIKYTPCRYNKRTVCKLNYSAVWMDDVVSKFEYSKSRFCYARLKSSYHSCKHKRQRSLDRITDDVTDDVLEDLLCSITGDYVKCIVGITALGCSLNAAELYFILLNETLTVAFEASGFSCELVNPLASVTRLPFPLATELVASKLESDKKTDRGLAAYEMKNATFIHKNDTVDGGHTQKPPINSTNRTNETPNSSSSGLNRMLLLPVFLIIWIEF